MPRGRRPEAAELKLLKGTRADRVPAPRPAQASARPRPPERFDEETRAEWDRLCDQLASLGVLNPGHGFALAVYCGAYARLLIAEKALKEHGPLLISGGDGKEGDESRVVIKSNPAAAMAAKCEGIMARILTEFGLTPSSASRVSSGKEAAPDAFSEFLKKKASR